MLRFVLSTVAVAALSARATTEQPKVAEIARGVKSVAFVQDGRGPIMYSIGAVDGKTSWSNHSILGARLNEPDNSAAAPTGAVATCNARTDVAAGAGVEIISGIGQSIADDSMKDDPSYYDRLQLKMVGHRELGLDTGRQVMPVLASAWKHPFSAPQLSVLPTAVKLEDDSGRYIANDPGTDLVLTSTLCESLLSEKPSAQGLKAVMSFGMYDREVMPYFIGDLAVYRRQAGGALQRLCAGHCGNHFAEAPAEEWVTLCDKPEIGGALLDKTLLRVAQGCGERLRQQLGAG